MKPRLVKLRDCADVLSGYSLKTAVKDEPDGTHQVIMGKHLREGEPYRYLNEHQLRITPATAPDNYLLKPGDILFMSRGTNNYAVLIEKVPSPTIAPATFYIVKAKKNAQPEYLMWCMEQTPFLSHLSEVRTGAGAPIVFRAGFSEIEIPLPDLATQQRIGNLWRLQLRERWLRQQLNEEKDRLTKNIGQTIYVKLTNIKEN